MGALTHNQWLSTDDPAVLLTHLRATQKPGRKPAGRRKLRLFACACCRSLVWNLPYAELFRPLVENAEQFADGNMSSTELRDRGSRLWADLHTTGMFTTLLHSGPGTWPYNSNYNMSHAMNATNDRGAFDAASRAANLAVSALERAPNEIRQRAKKQAAHVVREVFGDPFHQVAVEGLLSWKGGIVPAIAETIYREKRFEDMPILADALEEMGCDATIVAHCRQPGEHFLGCWAIDLLRERESGPRE